MSQALELSFWAYFERDSESRRWVAWVLDLDAMTVGEDLAEALSMAEDAAAMTIEHDLEHGLDPARHRAPDEIWAKWHKLMSEHSARSLSSVVRDEKELTQVSTQISVRVQLDERTATEGASNSASLAWPSEMCA